MSGIVLNHLDRPASIAGLPIKTVVLGIGAFFESFLAIFGGFIAFLILSKALKKFPKFYLMRLCYKNLPTKKVFGKVAPTLLQSHIEKWVK